MLLTGLLCGILLGFVMQRGRFCITGAFRDMYVTKNNKMFVALLLAITVQSIGFFLLKEIGVLNVDPAENFAFLAVIIGAFVFGIGIVLAGGCATGTWYRDAAIAYLLAKASLAKWAQVPDFNANRHF